MHKCKKITWNIDFVPPLPSGIHLLVGNGNRMKNHDMPRSVFCALFDYAHPCMHPYTFMYNICMPCHAMQCNAMPSLHRCYNETSKNGHPVLPKPPQYGQMAMVPNHSL